MTGANPSDEASDNGAVIGSGERGGVEGGEAGGDGGCTRELSRASARASRLRKSVISGVHCLTFATAPDRVRVLHFEDFDGMRRRASDTIIIYQALLVYI